MALDILFSIGGKIAELLVEPIGRRLMFIIRPSKNIPKLKSKADELEALRKGVQDSIDSTARNGLEIREDVKLWTERVDKLIEETKLMIQSGSHENTKCLRFIPNPATRYHKGKWAEEKTKELDELLPEGGNFTNTNIAKPECPLGIGALPSTGSVDTTYAAFRSAREQVMEALRDENINFIAIHGIGGVGKTTLVEDIGNKVKEDKLFDEVVKGVVSQNQDIKKIQGEIAGLLGLKLTDEPEIMIRATRLCERIKQVGTILVILDDVWDKLDLQTVGIPSDVDHQGCKIIITTRREQVCRSMGTVGRRKAIALNVLSDEDSWDLFRSSAGSEIVDSPKLNAIAKEVWMECGHLPLALVTVGSAMSGKEDPDEWKEAARQLKVAAPNDIEGVEEHVYKSIKLSFDYLKDETAKNVVLLCTLFPEDHDICIEDMVRYAWGLRMLRGGSIDTVQGARRRMKAMVNNLKDESLLLPSVKGGEFVKMHDVVRNVAIRIGSGKYISVAGSRSLENWPSMMRETMDKYEGISLMANETDNYPTVWDFPKLKILLLVGKQIGSLSCEHYLSKLKELNVLHVSSKNFQYAGRYLYADRIVLGAGHYAVSHLQTCLRTLILRGIDGPDIAAIGKITALEILDLKGCSFHDDPNASWIRALTNLRVLDLERTEFPNLVADTSFLSPDLTCLEELYMWGRTLSWDDMKIARNLPRLKVLEACTPDIETMLPDFVFPHQLETFCITLGCEWWDTDWDNHTPTLILNSILEESAYVWRGSLTTLLMKCRSLIIMSCRKMDSIFPDLSAKADDLKLLTHLEIYGCDEFRSIINTTTTAADAGHQQLLLSSLEYLGLLYLPRLEYIFKKSSSVSLCNLKRVYVEECDILKYLFQPAVAQSLVQLEELRVYRCPQLGEIVGDDQDGEEEKTNDNNIVRWLEFPNLKLVSLSYLPELRGFCCSRGDMLFNWPSLEELLVVHCPKMTTFARTSSSAGTLSTPKLRSVNTGTMEMIPQGMDLNQFLLLLQQQDQGRRSRGILLDTTYAAFRSAREQVMEALRDENINFIAIHGIPGVGKTTLVTDIWKKVKEDKLFDEVVFGVVSQNQDIKKIQREIASTLGLSLTDEPEIMIRATRLCERIKQVGTILVILDDVWDKLDLQRVGIPSDVDHQGCKIIITTRRKQVCSAMGAVGRRRKTVALNVLSDEDSWDLFRSRAGSEKVNSPKLNAIAKEVWRECGHLPLALYIVGRAMSDKEDPHEWKQAARQLKDAAPHDIEGMELVYESIKLSFDYLKDETAKNVVLLCTLFPEDHDICIEDMVRYAWGLRMFRGGSIDTVQGARRRMKAMVNNLKEESLLLPSVKGGEFVKMHDVVRDVAIRIGSGKYISVAGSRSLENWPSMMRETMDKYEGISLMANETDNYPTVWDFPKLKILLLVGKRIGSLSCEHYLSKLKELNVLHVSSKNFQYADRIVLGAGHYAVSHLQTCLRTLILRGIDGPDIAAIGKITALEILDLKGCSFHDTPNASWIRALTNLRVLDLERTKFPDLLADTSFLSPDLTCLEELYVDGTLSWVDMKIARNLPRLKVLKACTRDIETQLSNVDTTYAAFRSAREQVMEALRDENINFIAIHGIPGVGKTILVEDIGQKVKEDKVFHEVVIVMVSQNQDIKKIQREIASMLGLSLTDEPEIMIRATRLCERIKQVGTILVILDDVWDKLDLQTVGIPSDVDHQGCKIIITTRRKQVCSVMGAVGRRKTVALNVLSDKDSWDLFRSGAGSEKVNSPKLNAIAKEVWRECGHLPLALYIVGRAMSDKEDPHEWKQAARQLKDAAPHNIEGMKLVYESIKLSFDYLEDETAENVVLLCTLFPEDHDICIEDMLRYGWGLKMFRGGSIDTVQGARRRMKAMVNNLKEESLLLPSVKGGEFVKMHDVVRDVAVRIGSGKYISVAGSRSLENWLSMMRETMDKYEGISLMGNEIDNYPTVWDFPKLKILLLVGKRIGSLSCEHYLSKLKELNVLHVSPDVGKYMYVDRVVLGAGHYALSHLLQPCLRTVILRYIDGPDIAAIGKITTLEILDLKDCRFHDEPNASWIRALTNLRVLDLERTKFPNLLADTSFLSPDLTCLEELYVKGRLSWDDMKIARNLPRLKVLKACTPDIETMPPDFVFPHQLETFCITLGCEWWDTDWDNHTPTLILNSILEESAYVWRGSLTTLLTKCCSLTILSCRKMDSIFQNLSAREDDLKPLTRLEIRDCDEFRSIINTTTTAADAGHQQLLLSSLEYLLLRELPRLECIFKHSSSVSLCNLKHLYVGLCDILKKYLFQPAVAQSLVQLEVLRVRDCPQLGEIVGDDQDGDQGEEEKMNDNNIVRRLEFPNLKRVWLYNLPELRGFCCSRGDLLFDWPSLEYLRVTDCPKMTTFARTSSAGTPKLRSVQYALRLEMIPQGMDLNQFLLLKNTHGGGGAEEIHKTWDT